MKPLSERILQVLQGNPQISSRILSEELNVSRVAIYENLKKLSEENKVYKQGNGKATVYSAVEIEQAEKEIAYHIARQRKEFLEEIASLLMKKYDEVVKVEDLEYTFFEWFRYVDHDGFYFDGFSGFVRWCDDIKHRFINNVNEKAIEYLDIIGSYESRRGKNGFFDGTLSAVHNLKNLMEISFDQFFFCMPSVVENGFGRTKTALGLYFGKKNSNKELLEEAVRPYIQNIQNFLQSSFVDAFLIAPPSEGRKVQFRDVLQKHLPSHLSYIYSFKKTDEKRVIESQKSIKDRQKRVYNAKNSMDISWNENIQQFKHIVIFDDSFTTGATPNALALILRKRGFEGKITIITICGSFNYELSVSEDEI